MERFAYVFSLGGIFIVPSIVNYHFVASEINVLHLSVFILSVTVLGFVWDVWASKHGRRDSLWLWHFNKNNTIGIRIFDLPIEEILFYTFSSFYLITLWETIQHGYETESYTLLLVAGTLALWSCLFLITSYKLTGLRS